MLSNEKKRREYDEYAEMQSRQPSHFGMDGRPSFAFTDPWDVFANVSYYLKTDLT